LYGRYGIWVKYTGNHGKTWKKSPVPVIAVRFTGRWLKKMKAG
jgi:hypothetical protein